MDFNQAAVFVKVVQAGSFSAAARQLGLPTSTVSNRVAMLERRLGVMLLQRTTRRLNLTEAGDRYFQHARLGFEHLMDAESAVTEAAGEPSGLLRVTAPADLGDVILSGILSEMRLRFPKVKIEMVLTGTTIDLIAEGIDAAIRAGVLKDSTLVAKPAGIARWIVVASPKFLSSVDKIACPEDLKRHRCLQFPPLGRESWTLMNQGRSVRIERSGDVIVNDTRLVRALALKGEGVALLPSYLCHQDISDGTLHQVLPDWYGKTDPIHIVFPRQRFIAPKLRAFIDLAIEELKSNLERN